MMFLTGSAPEVKSKMISETDQAWKMAEPLMDVYALVASGDLKPSPLIVQGMACLIIGELLSRTEGRKKDGLDPSSSPAVKAQP